MDNFSSGHSYGRYPVLVICVAMLRQKNVIMKKKMGQFSALGVYYFFGLLMYDNCLSTFSWYKILDSWYNRRVRWLSPNVCIISLNFSMFALEIWHTSWVLRHHHQQREHEGAITVWNSNSTSLEITVAEVHVALPGGRNLYMSGPVGWVLSSLDRRDGGSQRGEADLKRGEWHMQQAPGQMLIGRQAVGKQENTIVSCCH